MSELQEKVREMRQLLNAKENEIAKLRELVQEKRKEIARLTAILRGEPLTIGPPTEVSDE